MVVLEFTNCVRGKTVVVCTQSFMVMFQGRVFRVERGDAADMLMLMQLRRREMNDTRVVILLNGEWEYWVAHVHFVMVSPALESKHYLLRLRWHTHNRVWRCVLQIQRWWRRQLYFTFAYV
jgi:hypothetical protein